MLSYVRPVHSFRILTVGLLYSTLYGMRHAYPQGQQVYGMMNMCLQVGLDLAVLTLAIRLWRYFGERVFVFLAVAGALAAFTDVVYNVCLQLLGITQFEGTPLELVINIPYLSFLLVVAFAMRLVVLELGGGRRALLGWWMVAISLLLVLGSLAPSLLQSSLPARTKFIHILCMFAESGIAGFALAVLLFVRHHPFAPGFRLAGAGALTLATFGVALQAIEIFSGLQTGLPVEFLWCAGQALIVLGLIALERPVLPWVTGGV